MVFFIIVFFFYFYFGDGERFILRNVVDFIDFNMIYVFNIEICVFIKLCYCFLVDIDLYFVVII